MTFPTNGESERLSRLSPPTGRVSMVLDTDTYNEIDDQLALVYSLLSPERLEVKAIYAAPFHNSRSQGPKDGMERSHAEIITLLDKLKRLDLPEQPVVCRGAEEWLTTAQAPVESEATAHLIRLVENQPAGELLYVVGIAAITNIASAILLKPEIIERIVVVWLAGHPHSYHHSNEFNLQQDIEASRVLLNCGVPLVMMPCYNVAEHLLLTREDAKNRLDGRGEIGAYLCSEFIDYADQVGADSRPIWDMAPIAWMIEPERVETALIYSPLLTTGPAPSQPYRAPLHRDLQSVTDGDQHCTWNMDPRRHLIREAFRVNRDRIFRDFFRKLESYTSAGMAAGS
jgi:purine nucleosidase